ncbi:hypothetical protein [Actinomadura violacea]|uniref:Uncharacterized protein n=1 Tax=Actinomadura violacea TaxID=2819934 RepID=A0ABS3RZN7_9ACTN|nr:hypothetical protein [Actinomadura violacea]MBO2461514.1 hypothetical protein [Actinomadura violacea]
MGFYTPAGQELSTAVWAALDVAGLKGLETGKEPRHPEGFGDGGFRLRGHGDKVEVFYAVDEFLDEEPGRHPIAAVMIGAIAAVLTANGFAFTVQPTTEDDAEDRENPTGHRYGAVLLVHAKSPAPPGTDAPK